MTHPFPAGAKTPIRDRAPIGRSGILARVWIDRRDLLALLFVLALALLLSIQQILLGGTVYDGDILLMSIPVCSWYSEQLRQGVLPIWSPAVLGGFPLAFAIYDFFYPPDILLFWLLDAARAFHLSLSLHLALAGMCTYWYCRVLGLRRLPSLVAAVAFQMGNQVLAWPSNGFITKALFALPALLAVIELMVRRSMRYWLLVPFVVGVALLVGHAQAVLSALATAGAYALVVAGVCWRALKPARTARLLLLLSVGVALGFGLAAVRVVPTLAVTSLTMRAGGMDFARSSVNSIEPWALVAGHLLPAVFELPGRSVPGPDYVGAPILLLAVLAAGALRRLDRVARFHVGLAVVITVLSLGEYTPAYGLLLHLPFFSYFREPNRLSLVAALAIAVLAAYALDRRLALGLSHQRNWYRTILAAGILLGAAGVAALAISLGFRFGRGQLFDPLRDAVAAGGWDTLNMLRSRVALPVLGLIASPLLLVACARGRISHRVLEWSVLGVTAGTLFLLGWVQNLWMPPAVLYDPPALLRTLKADSGLFRVFSWAPNVSTYNLRLFYEGVVGRPPSREFDERYVRQFIPPNLGILFGVSSAEWYDALQTRRQALFADYMGSERAEWGRYADGDWADWNLHSLSLQDRLNLLAAFNVKYLTHAFPIQDPRLELVDQVSMQIYPELPAVARVYLYRLKEAMPRAYVVPEAVVMPSEKDVLDALLAGRVDLRRRVILEEGPPVLEGPSLTVERSEVEVEEYRDDGVVLRVRSDGSGFLVLMDFLLPGWSVRVDGRPEVVQAGDFAGRAVPIRGAGEHRVEFSYRAPLLMEGLGVSMTSLVLLVSIPLVWRFRKRGRRSNACPSCGR